MPSEYKAATVTSGDVRARISGDVVNTSGLVALVSGQPILISGQYVTISGQNIRTATAGMIGDNAATGFINPIQNQDGGGRITQTSIHLFDEAAGLFQHLRSLSQAAISGHLILAAGLMAHDAAIGQLRRLETIASGEPILAIGHASGTRLISVSSQLISSGGQTYTGAAVTFALGKYTRFALYNSVARSGASGQTVETQMQFSDDAGTNWYDLVDGPFGAMLYEGVQVGAGTLRDVQTGRVAGGDMRVFIRTSGSTLNGSNNFTVSSYAMLLN